MNYDEALKLMQDRGYETHWRSGDREVIGMMKVFGDYEYVIHANVNVPKKTVNLSYVVPRSTLVLNTSDFSLDHSYFKKQFEDQMVETIRKIIY